MINAAKRVVIDVAAMGTGGSVLILGFGAEIALSVLTLAVVLAGVLKAFGFDFK